MAVQFTFCASRILHAADHRLRWARLERGTFAFAIARGTELEKENHSFRAGPEVNISFCLGRAVRSDDNDRAASGRIRPNTSGHIGQPFPVRTFKLGRLEAGTQAVTWDGLDENGQPIVEAAECHAAELERLKLTKPPTNN